MASRPLIQSSVLYRDLQRAYPTIVRGEGVYLWDAVGKRYLDGSGGSSAVTSIGHGVAEIAEAMASQARRVAFVPMHLFTSEPLPALAEAVAKFAPGDLNRVWFVSGGSEATENAAKFARQYWLERGRPSKSIVIGRWQSFHGNTLGSMGFGGHTIRRRKYVPMFNEASHLPPMYCYRCHFKQTYPSCGTYCADYLERLIRLQGPENVAAFIAEPVVGATLGAVPPVPEYFPKIREICDRHDVLFIADEVMTGFGRTGANFAVDHWGVVPDLIATAKGISGGYIPLGAVIVRDEIITAFERNQSSFVGGHTYTGHPVAAAVGLAVLRYIQEHDLVRNAREVGAYLLDGLRRLQTRHPIVGDVRGLGLMVGLEFVADRTTRTPFPPEREVARAVALEALERGLVTYPGTGSVDGILGDHMKFTPPLCLSRAQADELVGMLDGAIGAVEARL
jgi:adenosylmethionine-8-amino-7-oxononanoate aminotransferase